MSFPRFVFFLAVLALSCLTMPALGRDFRVDPGDVPELREGEGLLVVAVDSDLAVTSLTIKSETSFFTGGRLGDIGVGRTIALYVLPAGKYRWDRLTLGYWRWTLRENEEFRFEVKPGQITYAGDLVFRAAHRFTVMNRGLAAIDWLEKEHPRLLEKHGFGYVGHYPDAFPDFYRERLRAAGATAGERDKHLAPPAPGALPISVQTLWKPSRLRSLAMSPGGRYVAASVREGEKEWAIDLYDLAGGAIRRIADSKAAITELQWAGDDVLLAKLYREYGLASRAVFRLRPDGGRDLMLLPRHGDIVDPLPRDPDHILYASRGSRGEAQVHRVAIRDAKALEAFRFPARERLNIGLEDDFLWFTDARGRIRAALVRREDETVLVHGGDGQYQDVKVLGEPGEFTPLAVSGDGALIYGYSELDRDQRELVEFDPVKKAITRTVFAKPGVDVETPLFDEAGKLIGATYYEGGQLVSEYFDAAQARLPERLAAAFPGRTVAELDRDRGGRQLLLWVDGSDLPPRAYHLDLDAGRASLLEESMPWLADQAFAPTSTLSVTSKDGLQLEAYLTLPLGAGKRPLVVMPHGGPIGIADRRHFDPPVQFLASLGYAVLQVNFRGSEGYGKAFREAGHRNYGTGIEDDIDAAIHEALARHPLDESRICMVGASYGGYSGLMSAVRWPGRFRCVVSMSGVSDRSLFFTASDAARSAEGREILEKLIGNPSTEAALMRETSPLFQYERLQLPVMLVHGGEDQRVDYEHTRRLLRMLSLAGQPPVLLHFEDEGHSLLEDGNIEATWQGIAGFLRQHLEGKLAPAAPAAPAAAAATASPAGAD